jgi:hypothetical protein
MIYLVEKVHERLSNKPNNPTKPMTTYTIFSRSGYLTIVANQVTKLKSIAPTRPQLIAPTAQMNKTNVLSLLLQHAILLPSFLF